MRTIHKFPLELTDQQLISVPARAKIIAVGLQNGTIMLWAEVNTDYPATGRHIRIFGTGRELPHDSAEDMRYIGTVQLDGFVWHVYEVVS